LPRERVLEPASLQCVDEPSAPLPVLPIHVFDARTTRRYRDQERCLPLDLLDQYIEVPEIRHWPAEWVFHAVHCRRHSRRAHQRTGLRAVAVPG
jgi:hypothetical protein